MTAGGPDWRGLAALVLAVTVGGGWAAALVLSASPWTDQIGDEGAALLTTVGGVLAGTLAGYLGARRHDDD